MGLKVLRTPVFGTRADQREAAWAGIGATTVTGVYVLAVHRWSPNLAPSTLEIFGTGTSLACVWLTRRQNIWSIIYGIVSVVAMGIFFFEIRLVGQGWLHLGYYIPVQIVGWWAWLRAGAGRTDLPVGWMKPRTRLVVLAGVLIGMFVCATTFRQLHGSTPLLLWDSSIVAASVAAQLLLTTKRIESWWLWLLPVDVSAVFLYLRTDAEMFAALYCLYLFLASLGLRHWIRAWHRQRNGATAIEARLTPAEVPA